jgi:hypothetical protein
MTERIPYYWISPKNGRAYWRPNKRMMQIGFGCVSLGPAGEDAEQQARIWNARWLKARSEETAGLRRCDRARPRADEFVYFLQVGDRIKIGISRRPMKRLSAIVGAAPAPLKRIVVVIGNRTDESRLHQRFKAYRTGGEWFVASKPILLSMSRCAALGQVVHDGEPEERTRANRVEATGVVRVESKNEGDVCA